jgi:choline transport protein
MAPYSSAKMEPAEIGKQDARAHTHDAMDGEDYHDSLRGHTRQDRADMLRMGKVQELKRNYRPLSALAFTVILQGTWEVLLTYVFQDHFKE